MKEISEPNPFSDQFVKLKNFFRNGETRNIQFRRAQLQNLRRMILDNQTRIQEALYQDLHKHPQEAFVTEIAVVLEEIKIAEKKIAKWMRAKSKATPLFLLPATSKVIQEPLGCVLIIGPWNYPFHLVMLPLVGSISAGNCSILKSSEIASATSKLLGEIIPKYFSPSYIQIVDGGVSESRMLLELPFDHIFFTGSSAVGRIIMEAAAKNLTPVTLELGGKSPCLVDETANIDVAARRIIWGKFLNAGQTCVAPDYLYVQESIFEALLQRMVLYIEEFFGSNPEMSASYGRIISRRHFDRLTHLMKSGGEILYGGKDRSETLYISPTIIGGMGWDSLIMQQEIFGPLLPILTYKTPDEVIAALTTKDKPLAAYFFSEDKRAQRRFIDEISFGGGCINDTVIHLANAYLPFGGVGSSGMGSYHGEKNFLTFSHGKSLLFKSKYFDLSIRYPPYNKQKLKWLRRILGV